MRQEEKIKNCLKELIDNDSNFYDYVTPKGLKDLRGSIAKYLNKKLNAKINKENMIITSGSQQSIYLLSRILLTQHDTIISEEPTYFGAIKIFKEININILTVKIYDNGLNIDELIKKITSTKPKLIYVVPTFHNPTGISWSNNNRKKFLKLINKYNIIVIEDNPYSEFNYTDEVFKTLYELNNGKNVIYLGTFSKIICPSLSVGYILAENKVIKRLYEYKLLNDMNTSLFIQKFVNLYLNNYNIDEDIKIKKEYYKENIKHIKERLLDEFKDILFSNIKGGLFMTINIPSNKMITSLYNTNYYNKKKQNFIRINVSKTNIEDEINSIKDMYHLH